MRKGLQGKSKIKGKIVNRKKRKELVVTYFEILIELVN